MKSDDRFHRIVPGTNLLPVPIALSLCAVLLLAVTLPIDQAAHQGRISLPRWLSIGGPEDARAILGAILGAVSTVLALIFSVSLLVFSSAANQFGPRLMHRFLRDRTMQVTLGLFVATFLQSLLAFVIVRQEEDFVFVPQVTVLSSVMLVILSFGFLVIYNHRVGTSIQTNNVLARIVEDLYAAITELSKEKAGTKAGLGGASILLGRDETQAQCMAEGTPVRATMSGYVQRIQRNRLIRSADHADAVICLAFRPGQFVVQGETLGYVWPPTHHEGLAPAIREGVKLGQQRTLEQDLEFGIAQLVEIGLRALSQAINDMYTGLNCIDWLGDALRMLAAVPASDSCWRSTDGSIRLIEPPLRFSRVVKSAFDAIRQAAMGNAAVTIRLLKTSERLAPFLQADDQRQALFDQVEAIGESVSTSSFARGDREDLEAAYKKAHRALVVHQLK